MPLTIRTWVARKILRPQPGPSPGKGNLLSLELSNRRYRLGRTVMLSSAFLYALSRAATYLPNPAREVPKAMDFISVLVPVWVWAGFWLVAAGLCVFDLVRGYGRNGIGSVVGLMFAWGAIYLISYFDTVIHEGWGSREWSVFATFAFCGGMILGLLIKIGALKRRGEHE